MPLPVRASMPRTRQPKFGCTFLLALACMSLPGVQWAPLGGGGGVVVAVRWSWRGVVAEAVDNEKVVFNGYHCQGQFAKTVRMNELN